LPRIEILDMVSASLKEEMGGVKRFILENNNFNEESIVMWYPSHF